MADTQATIPIQFVWKIVRPDIRKFKQQSSEFWPQQIGGQDIEVEIDLPLTHEYVRNFSDVINHQLGHKGHQFPVLTAKGYKYLMDELESVHSAEAEDENAPWETETPETTESWGDSKDEDWSTSDGKKEPSEESWDGETENWDEE